MSYYFTLDGQDVKGPTTLQQLAEWVRQGKLPPTVYVCGAGEQEWKHLNAVVPAIQLAPSTEQAAGPSSAAVGMGQQQPASSSPATASHAAAAQAPGSSPAQANGAAQVDAARAEAVAHSVNPASQAIATRESSTALAADPPSDFKDIVIPSDRPVDLKSKKAKGTGLHAFLGYTLVGTIGTIVLVALVISTWGLILLIGGISYWLAVRRGHAQIHGGSVHVTEDQFPEIHRCVQGFAERLGMKSVPEVYVVEGSVINAFAARLGKRKYILLLDDLVYGCLETGDPRALSFIIGHEMAHHAYGHTGFFRSNVTSFYKALSRCDELSCDAVAADLVDNPQISRVGLAMLLVGPQLVRMLNWRALDRQARELLSKKTWKGAESSLTHPLLLRRYAELTGLG